MTSDVSEPESQSERKTRLVIVGLCLIIALFVPAIVILSLGGYGIPVFFMAMTWTSLQFGLPSYAISIFNIFVALPLFFFRLVFIYMLNRFYLGKTTRKRTLLVGVLAEAQPVAIFYFPYILMFMLSPGYFALYQILIPIPALFIVSYLLLKIRPPPSRTSWVDEEGNKSWWDEEEPASSHIPKEEKESESTGDKMQQQTSADEETESSDSEWLKDEW